MPDCSPEGLFQFTCSAERSECCFYTSLPTQGTYWRMFDLGQSDRWKWYVSASLNMQFSYCRWDWHLFKCLSHLNFFPLADCLLISLVHFFLLRIVGFFFFLIDLEELLIYDLEKKMATYFSILAWKMPWMEGPGRLQAMGSQRVRHNWATIYEGKLAVCLWH